jgi:PilZ domain
MHALKERRTHFRKRALEPAHIVLSDSAAKFDCVAVDLSDQGVRLRLTTTYGIPHRFDVVVAGKRRIGHAVWRTASEIGVMFAQELQALTDSKSGREQDIVPLIELLRMAAETWPISELGDVSEAELFQRDHALLEMWPEACRRAGFEVHEFPADVLKFWQQKMGWPN